MAPKKADKKAEAKKATKKTEAAAKAAPAKEEAPVAEKRKAEEPAPEAAEPAKKEAKVETPSEVEGDAPKDTRKKLNEEIAFKTVDTTLNVIPLLNGKVLASLTDGGMQYLLAGARASVGLKAGRYMFEVKIMETIQIHDQGGYKNPAAKPVVRVGFSTAASSLLLGDGEEQVFFDAEGGFTAGKKRILQGRRFVRDQTVAVVLNLDDKSETKNTISMFVDGVRACPPQALPEGLVGKTLFPHIGFRNVKVQTNFGPTPAKALPFECRMVSDVAAADAEKTKVADSKGSYEVVLPVAYPDEGTFEWLDKFLAEHPQYVELSDRKFLQWASASGLARGKGHGKGHSTDKPDFSFGVSGIDDFTYRKVLNSVVGLMPRNYVVMEVKSNLLEDDRKEILKRFNDPCFKKVAKVVMGEPPAEWKEAQHEKMLKDKQAKATGLWKARKMEKERKKELALAQKKAAAEKKKKIEEFERKKKEALERKKAAEEGKKKAAEGEEKKEGEEEKKEEEKKEEEPEKKEEEKKEEEATAMEVEEEEEPEEPEPVAELTDEEKSTWFAPKIVPDLRPHDFSKNFPKFSLPTEAEGFSAIQFEWAKKSAAEQYLKEKVLEKKKTSRVEDLHPSKWFQDTAAAFTKQFAAWQAKQTAWKNSDAGKKAAAAKKDEDAEEPDIDAVEDVTDVEGVPLFKDFALEDWALTMLRFEFYLLQAAFKKDVDDDERPGIQEEHFLFYYNRYFKKYLDAKKFGVTAWQDLFKLIKETVTFEDSILTPAVDVEAEDFASFLKQAEAHRRDRQRRISAGDETARLKVAADVLIAASNPNKGSWKGAGKGWGKRW